MVGLHVRDTHRGIEFFLDEQGLLAVPDGPSVEWQRTFTGENPPVSPDHHFAFYDPARDRIWVMSRFLSDTLKLWFMDLAAVSPQWMVQATAYPLADTTIQNTSLGYDPTHDRVLAFGGFRACSSCVSGAINDVYGLSLSGTPTWSRLVVGSGSAPSPRGQSLMGYDPWRDRMLVFGGVAFGPVLFDQTWALSLDPPMAWTQLTPTQLPPSGRSPSIGVLDESGHRWFIAGDQTSSLQGYSEVWALDLDPSKAADQAAWTRIPSDQNEPQPYVLHGMWAQPTESRMVAYDPFDPYHPNNVWTLAQGAAHWTLVGGGSEGLVRRQGLVAFVDPDSQRVYVGLGSNSSGSESSFQYRRLGRDELWVTLPTQGPGARASAVAVTDLAARRALVFGGSDYFALNLEGSEFRDLWSFDLDTQTWALVNPAGPMVQRAAALGVFDPIHRKLIVRGGRYTNPGPAPLGDTWIYDAVAGSWSYGGVSYGSRWGEVGIYDPVRQRAVAFGGTSNGTDGFVDVHVLPLSPTVGAWSLLPTSGTPTGVGGPNAVTAQTAAYDPIGDRMIITTGAGPGTEVWALSLAGTPTWTQLVPEGRSPRQRFGAALVSDPARQRMLLVGGADPGTLGSVYPIDSWAFYLDNAAVLQVGPPKPDANPHGDVLMLEGARPNPSHGELLASLSLASRGVASLELLDVGGRRWAGREVGSLGAGRHLVRLDASGERPPAGLYFLRLTQDGRALTTKVAIAR